MKKPGFSTTLFCTIKMPLLVGLFALLVAQAQAVTYTVTTVANAGAGSFRQALLDANANAGHDQIHFSIGTGPQSIVVTTALPLIDDDLTIDGSTQPGWTSDPIIKIGAEYLGSVTLKNSGSEDAVTLKYIDFSKAAIIMGYPGIGIELFGLQHATIENCWFKKNSARAIIVQASTFLTIKNNDLTDSGHTVHALYIDCGTNTGYDVQNNIFGGDTEFGVYLDFLENKTVGSTTGDLKFGTQLKELPAPIFFKNGNNITVDGLDLGKTTASGYLLRPLDIESVNTINVVNCDLSNRHHGLRFKNCSNVTATGNNLTSSGKSGYFGLVVNSVQDNLAITGNTFGGTSTHGVQLDYLTSRTIGATTGNIQVGDQLKNFEQPLKITNGTNITVSGLDLGNTNPDSYLFKPIDVLSTNTLTVSNCVLTNREMGLKCQTVSNLSVTGNNFTNTGTSADNYAVFLKNITGTLAFNGNTLGGIGSKSGLYLENLSGKTIGSATGDIQVGSQLKEFENPIVVVGGSNLTITGVDFGRTGPSWADNSPLSISGCGTSLAVTNCNLTNRRTGLKVKTSANVSITGNNLTNSGASAGYYALILENNTGTLTATGNTFGGTTFSGIECIGLSGKTICASSGDIQVGSQLKQLFAPLYFTGGSNITLSNLDLGPTIQGGRVYFYNTNTVTVTNCTLSNRRSGLYLEDCSNVSATGNNFTNSGDASGYVLFLKDSGGTLNVNNNTFGGNSQNGLFLQNGNNRIISDGSVSGTNIVIPDGSIFGAMPGTSITIQGGNNNRVEDVDLGHTGSTRTGIGLVVNYSTGFIGTINQIVKRNTGIQLETCCGLSAMNLTCNNVKDNTTGVSYSQSTTSAQMLNNNAIWLNSTGVFNSSSSQTVNATNNWWGSTAGPGSGGNNGVSGPSITTSPFLTVEPVCVELSALPIEMVFFKGFQSKNDNQLWWQTASEQNTAQFEIERSPKGQTDFEKIGETAAAGHSTEQKDYEFIDHEPPVDAFYRLKMIDRDGSFDFSNIVFLKRESGQTLQVLPNPAINEEIEIHFEEKEGSFEIKIFDAVGRLVFSKKGESSGGPQVEKVNLRGLAAGLFQLELRGEKGRQTTSFLKN